MAGVDQLVYGLLVLRNRFGGTVGCSALAAFHKSVQVAAVSLGRRGFSAETDPRWARRARPAAANKRCPPPPLRAAPPPQSGPAEQPLPQAERTGGRRRARGPPGPPGGMVRAATARSSDMGTTGGRAEQEAADRVAAIIAGADGGLLRLGEPVRLSSGAMSADFVDVKAALAAWGSLRAVADEIVRLVRDAAGIDWDAAGGRTMGADPIAVAVAARAGGSWFSVRKQPKTRGTARMIEGARIGPGWKVLIIEDVTTTGASALKAAEAARAAGAEVVAVAAVVNRGDGAERALASAGAPYFYLTGYADLGIEPVAAPPTAGRAGGPGR